MGDMADYNIEQGLEALWNGEDEDDYEEDEKDFPSEIEETDLTDDPLT